MAETKIKASQTDLIGGKNITLAPKYSDGGIDDNTLVLFNFENQNWANTGKGPLSFVNEPETGFTSSYKKFGEYGFVFNGTNLQYRPTASASTTWMSDFTIDFWVRTDISGRASDVIWIRSNDSYLGPAICITEYNEIYLRPYGMENTSGQQLMADNIYFYQGYHHVALCFNSATSTLTAFLDGVQKASYTYDNIPAYFTDIGCNKAYQGYGVCIDEYRFSNIVRYDGNFTPPTQAYTVASLLGTAINCTLADNPYKFVDTLPVTGEEGYVYGVYTNKTRDGYAIIQMFVWVNNAWAAFGAFDVDIDADNILYKTAITIDANNVVTIDLGD